MDVKPNVDRLHAVVTDARARKKAGYKGNDIWREDLQPSAAARARIMPILESERGRLKAQLEEVRLCSSPGGWTLPLTSRSLINGIEHSKLRCRLM